MTGHPLPAQFIGGPEILVIVLMGLVFFGLPLLVVLGGLGLWRASSNKDERISELEQRIADLEGERERGDDPEYDGGVPTEGDPAAGRDESATE